ncbi:MAG: mycofactocin biosynthesis FMN-dependent deaminase MftD [Solirubrobacterales bacterium]|nr:mycofactocin biosynthesis FMN-dependent deaminase MftD [Solirubrobacterales bacterium]
MASTSTWFESVAEARRLAERRLPSSVFQALHAGSESGGTLGDNVAAFGELGLIPRVATGVSPQRGLATTVMGQEISMPVLISPTGVQAVHPDGEVAVARAAAGAGVAMGLGSFASKPIEEVVAVNPSLFFQVYWMGSREQMETVMQRARAAGARGLIVTLDWTFTHRRDWGSPAIPERIDLGVAAKMAPQVLRRPRWLGAYLRQRRLPDLTVPNVVPVGEAAPGFFTAYGEWMMTPQPSWSDLAWLCETWGGPTMIKGIYHPEDARQAVAIGADAISVSNHGGNNLDSTPAAIRALPGVVDAVGDEIEVMLDGGIRRGSDVVKAVALGARAVMIGRAYLWGLAARGEAGVANVLEILRAGIEETLLGLGRDSIADLRPEDVLVPDGFTVVPPS